MLLQQGLEVRKPTFQEIDIASRNLTLGDWVVAYAANIGLFAGTACRVDLVASVLSHAATIACGNVSEGGGRRGRRVRRGARSMRVLSWLAVR